MAYDGVIEDVRLAVRHEKPRRLPIFACSEEFDVRWYGKFFYEEVCQDGEKIAEVWAAAIDEFDYDWAWVQVDDCFEFEPLGVGTYGEGDILRATRDYLPVKRETLTSLKIPTPESDGRMPEKLKAIRLLKEHFGQSVLIEGSCAAPYSSVGLLFGLQDTMIMSVTEPELLADACELMLAVQTVYVKAQIEAGADAIWLGDCNAFSAMLSLNQYRQYALPFCKRLIDVIHDCGAMAHLHNSEISTDYLLAEAETGADIINCGPAADIAEVRNAMTGVNCFSGNLDPIEVLMRGTPEDVSREAKRIVQTGYAQGGYLFNTGEMNPRDTPVENMKAMINSARETAEEMS
ncbi:MAG: hypothetical protein JXM70_20580 [Pirellulales bacterium]|nr:hypothetical protein [Pirellulales bacterium]